MDRLPIAVELDFCEQRLPRSLEESVYFFITGALANVVNQAHATAAAVQVAGAVLLPSG